MRILDFIQNPADVKKLTQPELDDLASEIRQFLVENVLCTGGHLGPNLGVVELTIALHQSSIRRRTPSCSIPGTSLMSINC